MLKYRMWVSKYRMWVLNYKMGGGTSLVIQWLRLCAFNVRGARSICGQGTKILQAIGC